MRRSMAGAALALGLAALPAVAVAGPPQVAAQTQATCPQEHLREMDREHAAMHAQMQADQAQMGVHMARRGPDGPGIRGDGS